MTSNKYAALTRLHTAPAPSRAVRLSRGAFFFFSFFFFFLVFKEINLTSNQWLAVLTKATRSTPGPRQCETDQTPPGEHGANTPKSQRSLLVIRALLETSRRRLQDLSQFSHVTGQLMRSHTTVQPVTAPASCVESCCHCTVCWSLHFYNRALPLIRNCT